mmetsp:Transcript_16842/g.38612  ORF Transcript_16842/g.38612 Transcript_16842/m.38612 type:complete len:412 (-) Transcript_16842:192-1427(-)|eukprot:CAMPEP_0172395706 /NCGR_PEP_ID=MMETSP1061-20121228/21251_1 /TAXON_ID=37318 /ORGANISM="Pseudo-nitzschia pungens, Strain cf. pungens" /LENGTH=411 /DNA_ID=CAMNT_0013127375 /DNA_START=212 /DNA_END=1447 /DNA_ORIENTATION=-
MVYSDSFGLENQGLDGYGGFPEKSLAAADSLALCTENEIYVEHVLPSDEYVATNLSYAVANKEKIVRRKWIPIVSTILLVLIGIIVVVLSVVLTRGKNSSKSFDRGSTSQSIDGIRGSLQTGEMTNREDNTDVIVLEADPLPEIYFLLESKVNNPEALLDINTPEGKAFNVLVEESKREKRLPRSIDNDDYDLERYALLVLYFGADGGAWTNTAGWSSLSGACDNWHGVTCLDSFVTGIDLDGNNLHGKVPEDFCLIRRLKTLRLGGNKVELPSCVSNLSALEELDFKGNSFAGRVPVNLYSMGSIMFLDLSDNEFSGSMDSLFPELSTSYETVFPKLSTLNLSNNKFSGEIPQNMLRRMTNLDSLVLSGNPTLTGSLNEICKGDSISKIDADCKVACKCCTSGNKCPSSV